MAKSYQFLHKTFLIALCLFLISALIVSASLFLQKQNIDSAQKIHEMSQRVIKQSTVLIAPLVNSYNSGEDNGQQIATIIDKLSQQDWIIEIAIYQIDGPIIAQQPALSEKKTSVRKKSESEEHIVERIELSGNPVGFMRIVIDRDRLTANLGSGESLTIAISALIIMAAITGFILANILTLAVKPRKEASKAKEI